jgi:transcription elongation factor GreB
MDLRGLITETGYHILEKKLQELMLTREVALKDMVEARKIPGDDNPELIYSQAQLFELDNSISELDEILASSLIMQTNAVDIIGFGSIVVYEDESGKENTGRIVGTNEVIYMDGCISVLSPMAEAMFGLGEGEVFDVMVGKNISTYTVVSISL